MSKYHFVQCTSRYDEEEGTELNLEHKEFDTLDECFEYAVRNHHMYFPHTAAVIKGEFINCQEMNARFKKLVDAATKKRDAANERAKERHDLAQYKRLKEKFRGTEHE